jgi:hypothetical protein
MRVTPSVNEHGSKPRAGRRQRRIGITMLVAGIIVLVAAFAPTSANAVIPNSALVPAGPATFDLSCTGRNGDTNDILNAVPGLSNPFVLPGIQLTTNGIPSPADGEEFSLDFTWQFILPQSLAHIAVVLGNTDIVQANNVLAIHADSGATGPDAVGHPPDAVVPLGDGSQAVAYNQGPLTGTFTRSGTGNPVQFSPGVVSTDARPINQDTGTTGPTLLLACTPTNLTPLVLNDQAGPPPPPTQPRTPPTPPPTTAPPSGPTPTGGGSTTRSSALARTGFHPELLYLGIALLGAGYALSLAGRRVARAAARSR